jgi:hypothetical protein
MTETTSKQRQEIAEELEKTHGQSIASVTSEMYENEPGAIGTALTYFVCGCVLLRCFDESGDIIGAFRIIPSQNSCGIDHTNKVEGGSHGAVYKSVLWRMAQEEFDRIYGNDHRVIIAHKLFPPEEDE